MNILLYKGQSQYGVLRYFIDEMSLAFTKLGHNVDMIDLLSEDDRNNKLKRSLNNGCDFVFAFNGMGIDLISGGRSVYNIINVPFVAALADHPFYHILRLNTKINHLIVTCGDKSHLDFLSSNYSQEHIKVKSWMLTGSSSVNSYNEESFDDYLKNRTIPILFAGSFSSMPQRTWLNLPPGISALLDDVADCILGHDCIALEEAYNYVLNQRSMELSQEMQKKLYLLLLPLVDRYIRSYCRYRCLDTLAQAEIPLVLCSNGWDSSLSKEKYKSVTFVEPREYEKLLNDLQKTKLYLSTTLNTVYGYSDRIYSAMLSGAVNVTQANYSEDLVDGQDAILYKWTKLDRLPQRIFQLLENPETIWHIAKCAREKAKANHTWLKRAEQVLNIVTVYKDLCNIHLKT